MATVTVQTKGKIKSKVAAAKRPIFEGEYFAAMKDVLGAFNQIAGLKQAGLMLEASLNRSPVRNYEEGTNWGSSYYEDWGTIAVRLAKGDQFIDLASYRVREVNGQPELSTNTHIAKHENYADASFAEPEGFARLLKQLSGSVVTAVTDGFKLGPAKIAKIEADMTRLSMKLEAAQAEKCKLADALAEVQDVFPNLTMQQIITGPLADYAFGPKQPWANLPKRRLIDTMVANVGANVICLYLDGAEPEPWVLVGERPDPKLPGAFLFNGSGGGYGNLFFSKKEQAEREKAKQEKAIGEQPRETAAREFSEENLTPDGQPIFTLQPEQLHLIDIGEGIDYKPVEDDPKHGLPTAFSLYYAWLDETQTAAAKAHVASMEDPAYRAACALATKNETSRMRAMRLSDAAALPMERGAYAHETKAFRRLWTMHKAGKLER